MICTFVFMEVAKCMFKVNKGLIEPNCNNIYKPIATIHQHKTRSSSANNYFIHSTNLANASKILVTSVLFSVANIELNIFPDQCN